MTSWQATADSPGRASSSQVSAPPGRAHGRILRAISPSECLDLLEPGGIGRVGFTAGDAVVMLPVNFAVLRKAIIFRTAADTLLALHANARLSFEVDHFDQALAHRLERARARSRAPGHGRA